MKSDRTQSLLPQRRLNFYLTSAWYVIGGIIINFLFAVLHYFGRLIPTWL